MGRSIGNCSIDNDTDGNNKSLGDAGAPVLVAVALVVVVVVVVVVVFALRDDDDDEEHERRKRGEKARQTACCFGALRLFALRCPALRGLLSFVASRNAAAVVPVAVIAQLLRNPVILTMTDRRCLQRLVRPWWHSTCTDCCNISYLHTLYVQIRINLD